MSLAFTSRALDISTEDLAANAGPGEKFFGKHASNNGHIMIFAGGVPLLHNGQVVGAVGVSGGSGKQDKTVAETAATAM